MSLNIEAITVCVQYSDFLEETARHNRHLFNRWTVVTKPDDRKTLDVCKRYHLRPLVSKEFFRSGEGWNKGRAISHAQHQCSTNSWLLHIDADVVLPTSFRYALELADIDKDNLYGADRIYLHSWDEWKKLEASNYLQEQHMHRMVAFRPNIGDLAHRIYMGDFGYVPIGYFQLWWGDAGTEFGEPRRDYPHTDSDAAHSDIKFALHWPRRNRVLIPELLVVHLESERRPYGVNWGGRRSKPFGPANVSLGQDHPHG